ncbi:MAG: hypothetical protein U5K30_03130 [Acidimicrobiales bacterium]|nr:hypothetical protein [Acidimicrobiales bacterium]
MFDHTELLVTVMSPPEAIAPPAPSSAGELTEFDDSELLVMTTFAVRPISYGGANVPIAPPPLISAPVTVLAEKVLLVTVTSPWVKMAPPSPEYEPPSAVFDDKVLSTTVTLRPLDTAPP